MNETGWRRWGAASGFAALALGAAATVFERGPVNADDPATTIATYFKDNGDALRAQSLLFIIGAGALLWFVGSLRSFLIDAEGATGRLSTVAFGAGIAWVALSLTAQVFQIGLAGAGGQPVPPALIATMDAAFIAAGLPLAVMLAAVAIVSARTGTFRAWLAWLSIAAAVAQLIPLAGIVVDSGPLALDGWLTLYGPYPLLVVWLAAATTVMVVRAGRPKPTPPAPDVERATASIQ